jgi:predicted amidophosphoribosyltransferase
VARLTVIEAAATYQPAMRNVLPPGPGVCAICKTFIGESFSVCIPCRDQPNVLDAVVPITYSEHLGSIHNALRGYKNGLPDVRDYLRPRVAAILWRFLELHEPCVARAAGAASGFDMVTTVPSSARARDRRNSLRTIAGWCKPIKDRLERVLEPTDQVPGGRAFDPSRYAATRRLSGEDVLLIDDTWTSGGHGQSAAQALKDAGARRVGLVVIGRHMQRDWQITVGGPTNGERLDELPQPFDWETCAVHA